MNAPYGTTQCDSYSATSMGSGAASAFARSIHHGFFAMLRAPVERMALECCCGQRRCESEERAAFAGRGAGADLFSL